MHSLFAKSKSEHTESYLLKYHLLIKTLNELLCVLVTQSCPTLCSPMDYSLPDSPLSMGFPKQEILEWVAISFSRGSNLGLLNCRQMLYHLSHQGNPQYLLVDLNSILTFNYLTE